MISRALHSVPRYARSQVQGAACPGTWLYVGAAHRYVARARSELGLRGGGRWYGAVQGRSSLGALDVGGLAGYGGGAAIQVTSMPRQAAPPTVTWQAAQLSQRRVRSAACPYIAGHARWLDESTCWASVQCVGGARSVIGPKSTRAPSKSPAPSLRYASLSHQQVSRSARCTGSSPSRPLPRYARSHPSHLDSGAR